MVNRPTKTNENNNTTDKARLSVASMVESIIGCKWSIQLLLMCSEGRKRPSEFLKACKGLSAKVMNERLQKMLRFGILKREVFGEKPPIEVYYSLTEYGSQFIKIIELVRQLQASVDSGAFDINNFEE
jgi:DNA-binding HxlR family transcriptional regulator